MTAMRHPTVMLNVHRWGPDDGPAILCLHGVTGHGQRFRRLADRLPGRPAGARARPARARSVAVDAAVDGRAAHPRSDRRPRGRGDRDGRRRRPLVRRADRDPSRVGDRRARRPRRAARPGDRARSGAGARDRPRARATRRRGRRSRRPRRRVARTARRPGTRAPTRTSTTTPSRARTAASGSGTWPSAAVTAWSEMAGPVVDLREWEGSLHLSPPRRRRTSPTRRASG